MNNEIKMYDSWILEDAGSMDENGNSDITQMYREKLICPSCGAKYIVLFPNAKRECDKCGAKILRSRFIPFLNIELLYIKLLSRYEEEDYQWAKENGYDISEFKHIELE